MSGLEDSHIQTLIAHYLKEKNLTKTLQALELEVNRKFQYDSLDEPLSSIINDRTNFLKLKAQQNEMDPENSESKLYTPQQLSLIKTHQITVPSWTILKNRELQSLDLQNQKSLIIDSSLVELKLAESHILSAALFVTNDKYLYIHDIDNKKNILELKDPLKNGVSIKLVLGIPNTDYVLLCGMNGLLIATQLVKQDNGDYELKKLAQAQLHQRLISSMKYLSLDDNGSGFLCSIGWDLKVAVHKVDISNGQLKIKKVDDYKLITNGCCIEVLKDEETNLPLILVGRIETSMISVFTVSKNRLIEVCKVALNDSEFSNHSFQAMSILQLGRQGLITFATNHIPYMRLITIKLPTLTEVLESNYKDIVADNTGDIINGQLETIASTHKNEQLFQSRTPIIRNVIVSNLNGMSPQDKFSNAMILRRGRTDQEDGVWIFGDDGVIRGFNLATGEVVENVKAHDGRIKSGFSGVNSKGDEVVVTCGAVDRLVQLLENV
ncbi:unnamed protein product [Ambrosiozyma monospora]|uniref:Unnamed protein product n=1 Tax=Ambrosiozyma monospora TaxID=43982 RepID=A0ACB5SZG0_AMBMO|nr:unnamed protein product [Ambrosiozyma monospora]